MFAQIVQSNEFISINQSFVRMVVIYKENVRCLDNHIFKLNFTFEF